MVSNITFIDLVNLLKGYNEEAIAKVKLAYDIAASFHYGQTRESGEEYITHPLNVAYILATMHADADTICAGLLHDVLEDTSLKKEELVEFFGKDVANLVDGVTKISKLNFSTKEDEDGANTRKIITGITDDVRIIIIKLADRLHNMRTLQFKKPFKQKENALETMEIFVPLAYYIGAYRIKNELEDLSLKYLKPDDYYCIQEQKEIIETDSQGCIQEMLFKIEQLLSDKNIPNEIKVRTKNIYGIYKKLAEGHKLSDIHDLLALKIMVETVDECYRTLGLIHSSYKPINEKFKDYICNPKTNMYQSLHTTVFAPDNRLVQTQIRTFNMDKVASYGLATYWDINNGDARNVMQQDLKDKFQFFKSLVDIDAMFGDNLEFVEQIKNELFAGKVYIYTPKGKVIELPKGSTPIDFAYKIHTDIGNSMVAAIVNEESVPIGYILKNKDRVRIITDSSSMGPKEDWIEHANTSNARKKIREYIKK